MEIPEIQHIDTDESLNRPGRLAQRVMQLGIMSGALRGQPLCVEPIFFRFGNLASVMQQPKIQTIAGEVMSSKNDVIFFIEAFLDRILTDQTDPNVAALLEAARQAADAYGLPVEIAIGLTAIDFWNRRAHA